MARWLLMPALGLVTLAGAGADWRQFRGSDLTGLASESAPEHFGPDKNVAWKVDLPGRGLSSPVVVGNRVILTACTGKNQDRLHVLAFDSASGRQLWEHTFWATGPEKSHPKTNMAAPTPASDGKVVVALFATDDLVCLDLDGKVRWVRSLFQENPGASDGRGLASSPVIVDETAVIQMDNQNNSFALGVDVQTGKNRWRISRPRDISWTTPVVLPGSDPQHPLVLLQGNTLLAALEPRTGKEVWQLKRNSHPIASSVVAGNVLYVPGEDKGLQAFELQGTNAPKLLWQKPKLNPDVASPVVLDGRIYILKKGILAVGDAKTGEVLGQLRVKGDFSSSLVAAGGVLYCFNEEGVAHVVKPDGKEGKLIDSSAFKETILCTPAVVGGALYVRSDQHLWKIAKS